MSARDDGGPAFPVECSADHIDNGHQTGHRLFQQYGMTLRDYFAAHATEADIEDHRVYGSATHGTREQCRYAFADAMLKARAA